MKRHAKAIVAISALLLTLALGIGGASADAPVISINAPGAVTYTTAQVSGTVDPKDHETFAFFEYSKDGVNWDFYSLGTFAADSGPQAVSGELTGLQAGTQYEVRLGADNYVDPRFYTAEPNPTFTTDAVVAPTLSIADPTAVTGTSAHFSATINPNAPEAAPTSAAVEDAFRVNWRFECTPECPGLSGGTVAADNTVHTVEADTSGLKSGVAYQVKLIATNAGAPVSAGPKPFTTTAVAPTIEATSVKPQSTEAWLAATVNPGAATDFYFEYGPTDSYGQSTVTETIPAGNSPVKITTGVAGLLAGTGYHFRAVAFNAAGAVFGPDQSFTTAPPVPADTCPNAAIRAEQGATSTGDCRAFEMVSPVAKNGFGVEPVQGVLNSTDGNGVAFASNGWFADASASLSRAYYVARRGADGWITRGVEAPQRNTNSLLASTTLFLSSDLSKSFQYSQLALTADAEEQENLYLTDERTGVRKLVASTKGKFLQNDLASVSNRGLMEGTPDVSHLLFQVAAPLLPEAPPNSTNIYELVDGELRIVNVREDGTVNPGGASFGSSARASRSLSADASKVFFTMTSEGQIYGALYVRINGTTTKPISVSRRSGDPSTPVEVTSYAASKDGNVVYFLASQPLTEEVGATNPYNLYKYDLRTDTLTLAFAYSTPPEEQYPFTLNAVSEDGEYAYFTGWPAFTPDAHFFNTNFYVVHDGEVKLIAALPFDEANGPETLETSRNGRYLAFTSIAQLTDADNRNPACQSGSTRCREMYVYDNLTGELKCPSCDPIDGRHRDVGVGLARNSIGGQLPNFLLADNRVVFDTPARLVSADTNDAKDVYIWDGQGVRLVSSGRGSADAEFAQATPDGRNVFFVTAEKLLPQDIDGDLDLYDARVEGGWPYRAPSTPVCAGESCRGPATAAPPQATPGSSQISGPGNKSRAKKRSVKCKKTRKHKAAKKSARCTGKKSHGKAKS